MRVLGTEKKFRARAAGVSDMLYGRGKRAESEDCVATRFLFAVLIAAHLSSPAAAEGTYTIQSGGQQWGAVPLHVQGGEEVVILIPKKAASLGNSAVSAAAKAYIGANHLPCNAGDKFEWFPKWGGWKVPLVCSAPLVKPN